MDSSTKTANEFGDHLASKNRDKYVEYLATRWASENPSLSMIYLNIGYDEYWGMISPYRVGCFNRVRKMLDETWHSTDLDHWSKNKDAFLAKYYIPRDGLPGILEDDASFFE